MTGADWQDELQRWLAPFLSHLGHKARRRMCPLYVAGLIGPGERKSVQPIASRTPGADYVPWCSTTGRSFVDQRAAVALAVFRPHGVHPEHFLRLTMTASGPASPLTPYQAIGMSDNR